MGSRKDWIRDLESKEGHRNQGTMKNIRSSCIEEKSQSGKIPFLSILGGGGAIFYEGQQLVSFCIELDKFGSIAISTT